MGGSSRMTTSWKLLNLNLAAAPKPEDGDPNKGCDDHVCSFPRRISGAVRVQQRRSSNWQISVQRADKSARLRLGGFSASTSVKARSLVPRLNALTSSLSQPSKRHSCRFLTVPARSDDEFLP